MCAIIFVYIYIKLNVTYLEILFNYDVSFEYSNYMQKFIETGGASVDPDSDR